MFLLLAYLATGVTLVTLPTFIPHFWERVFEGIQFSGESTPAALAETMDHPVSMLKTALMWPLMVFVARQLHGLRKEVEGIKKDCEEMEADAKLAGAVLANDPSHPPCFLCRVDARACAQLALPLYPGVSDKAVVFKVLPSTGGPPRVLAETRNVLRGPQGNYTIREKLEANEADSIKEYMLTVLLFGVPPSLE